MTSDIAAKLQEIRAALEANQPPGQALYYVTDASDLFTALFRAGAFYEPALGRQAKKVSYSLKWLVDRGYLKQTQATEMLKLMDARLEWLEQGMSLAERYSVVENALKAVDPWKDPA